MGLEFIRAIREIRGFIFSAIWAIAAVQTSFQWTEDDGLTGKTKNVGTTGQGKESGTHRVTLFLNFQPQPNTVAGICAFPFSASGGYPVALIGGAGRR
jgi:hypothetical protein